jgi:phosphate transport system substrate-binding protein
MKNIVKAIVFSSLISITAAAAGPLINGAGSTFAEPVYTKWINEYQKTEKDSKLNYQGIGSGAGIKQLIAGTVDFAGTDVPMNKEETDQAKKSVLHIPVAMGAVVLTYNLTLPSPLKLSGAVIADIFSGKITKWNDAKIQALNKVLALPATDIAVATRSDGSGTTGVFSEYLAKVSPEWVGKDGKTVNWFKGSLGGKGNAGVTGLVKQTPGSIGYVELVYALENKLPFADIQNKAGKFVTPSAKTVTNAAAGISKDAIAQEFKISITDAKGKDSYPISAFTWMLLYNEMDKEKGTAIKKFATWALGEQAQDLAGAINYAPVPKDLRAAVLKKINTITTK